MFSDFKPRRLPPDPLYGPSDTLKNAIEAVRLASVYGVTQEELTATIYEFPDVKEFGDTLAASLLEMTQRVKAEMTRALMVPASLRSDETTFAQAPVWPYNKPEQARPPSDTPRDVYAALSELEPWNCDIFARTLPVAGIVGDPIEVLPPVVPAPRLLIEAKRHAD